MSMETEGTTQRGCPKKAWLDFVWEDMGSFSLAIADVQDKDDW